MSLSVRIRFEVFKRDRFTCAYCGNHPPDVLLEVDHILPIAGGGTDDLVNLVTACWDCNRGKADRLLEEGTAPAVNEANLALMQERLDQAKAYVETLTALQSINDQMVWRVIEAWAASWGATRTVNDDGSTTYSFPNDSGGQFPSRPSIKRFLRTLNLDDVIYAVEETAARKDAEKYWPNEWACRYFYGICQNLIRLREHDRSR